MRGEQQRMDKGESIEGENAELEKHFFALAHRLQELQDSGSPEHSNTKNRLLDSITTAKLRFLLDWYIAYPKQIDIETIEENLVGVNPQELHSRNEVGNVLGSHIELFLLKGEYDEVHKMLSATIDTFPDQKVSLSIRIYRNAMALHVPGSELEYFRTAVLDAGYNGDKLVENEPKWKALANDPGAQTVEALDRIKSATGRAYRHSSIELGDELVGFIKKFVPSFEDSSIDKRPAVDLSYLTKMDTATLLAEYAKYEDDPTTRGKPIMNEIIMILERGHKHTPEVVILITKARIEFVRNQAGKEKAKARIGKLNKIESDLQQILSARQDWSPELLSEIDRLLTKAIELRRQIEETTSKKLKKKPVEAKEFKKKPTEVKEKSPQEIESDALTKAKKILEDIPNKPDRVEANVREIIQILEEYSKNPVATLIMAKALCTVIDKLVTGRPKGWRKKTHDFLPMVTAYTGYVHKQAHLLIKNPETAGDLIKEAEHILQKINLFSEILVESHEQDRKFLRQRWAQKQLPEETATITGVQTAQALTELAARKTEIFQLLSAHRMADARREILEALKTNTEDVDILNVAFDLVVKDSNFEAAYEVLAMLRPHIPDSLFKQKLASIRKYEGEANKTRSASGKIWNNFGSLEPINRVAYDVTEGEARASVRKRRKDADDDEDVK